MHIEYVNQTIKILKPTEFNEGLTLFVNAMGFTESFIPGMVDTAKFYYDQKLLFAFGLYENEELCGFGSIIFHKKNTWIPWVSVKSSKQGNGYGKKIMIELLGFMQNKKRQTVELCASNAGYPLYEKLGFQYQYHANVYTIKSSKDIQLTNSDELFIETKLAGEKIPKWLIELDETSQGVNRKDYLEKQLNKEYIIAGAPNKGFAIIANKKIGPIVAKDKEYAKNLFQTGLDLGIDTVIPLEFSGEPSFVHELAELELVIQCRKMTYGPLPNQKHEFLYAIKSTAFG